MKTRKGIVGCVLLVLALVLFGEAKQVKMPSEYTEAYHGAMKDGKPLMVLISMNGCPGCVEIEKDAKYGEPVLKKQPHYLKIMWEDYPDLACLVAGTKNVMTPTLCCFWYKDKKWTVKRFVGAASIRGFVKEHVVAKNEKGRSDGP